MGNATKSYRIGFAQHHYSVTLNRVGREIFLGDQGAVSRDRTGQEEEISGKIGTGTS